MKKQFKIKDDVNAGQFTYLVPDSFIVLAHVVRFCNQSALPLVVTNLIYKFAVSKSNTHPQGRAFDISVRGWTITDIKRCIKHVTEKCGHLGAISGITLTPRVAYFHDSGLGAHIHFQVYSLI